MHFYPLDLPNKIALKSFDIFVGLTDFGCKLMKDAYPNKTLIKIPLCVDLKMYNMGIKNKTYYKKLLGFSEDHFVCSMVANNEEYIDRKAFRQNLKAFAKLQKKYSNCRLYLHTNIYKVIDLTNILRKEKVKNKKYKYCQQIKYNNHGYSREDVANIFRASDVLLSASKSEGFGIPIIEAQACGCSVVTTNFSSMPELTVNGICTKYNKIENYPDDKNCFWSIPDIDNIFNALDTIYNWTLDKREEMISKGINFAKTFSKENMSDKIKNLLDNVSQEPT